MRKQSKWVLSVLILVIANVASFTTTYADEIIDFKSPEIDAESLEFKPKGQIPGTNIQIGSIYFRVLDQFNHKNAFKTGGNLHYLEFSKMYKSRDMKTGSAIYFDIDYGIYKNFLLIRGFEGATGYNAWLFLFEFDKDNIKLIDVIQNDYIERLSYDFFLDFQEEENLYGIKRKDKENFQLTFYPLIDRDNDGNPEVKLFFTSLNFALFVEASKNALKVDLNPKNYIPQFELLKNKEKKNKEAFRNYIIYGFITGAFDRDEIKKKVAGMKKPGDADKIMKIIDNLNKLNDVLHPKEQIILKKIEKEGGK